MNDHHAETFIRAMQPTPYERLGGAPKIRELVDRFYDLMETLPEARDVRKLHPANLQESRDKLFLFLSGWLGGPPLYSRKFGHPRLAARHLAFSIGTRERDQWLRCMFCALGGLEVEESLRQQLQRSFYLTANHMRNRPEAS